MTADGALPRSSAELERGCCRRIQPSGLPARTQVPASIKCGFGRYKEPGRGGAMPMAVAGPGWSGVRATLRPPQSAAAARKPACAD